MSEFHDHLRSIASSMVDDLEKAGAELATPQRRSRVQRAAETLVAYPFAALGASAERRAKLDERRKLALSTIGNTQLAITIQSRAAVEKIVQERMRQLIVLMATLAGFPAAK